jgi:hypothetical protein
MTLVYVTPSSLALNAVERSESRCRGIHWHQRPRCRSTARAILFRPEASRSVDVVGLSVEMCIVRGTDTVNVITSQPSCSRIPLFSPAVSLPLPRRINRWTRRRSKPGSSKRRGICRSNGARYCLLISRCRLNLPSSASASSPAMNPSAA